MNGNRLLKIAIITTLLLTFLANLAGLASAASSTARQGDFPGAVGNVVVGWANTASPIDTASVILPPALTPRLQSSSTITVTKTADPDPVNAGEVLTYTIVVETDSNVIGTTITDTLDGNVSFASASHDGTHDAGSVTWDVGGLNGGETITRTLTVTVNNITSETTLTNSVVVTTTEGDTDSDAIGTTAQPSADLAISKSDNPATVIAGTTLTYTVIITNNGPSPAADVVVSDTLPGGLTFVPASSSNSCSGTLTITCNLGTLAKGATQNITIVTTVGASVRGVITNTASVTSTTNDPTGSNNSDDETTTVNGQVDLVLTKTDQPDPVTTSEFIQYTITITNNGPSNATGVIISDTLPNGMPFQGATPSICVDSPPVICTIPGTIINNNSFQLTIFAKPTSSGIFTNTATVSANEAELNSANNTDTESTTVNLADLSITKSASPNPVLLGHTLNYTLTIVNNGPNDALNVVVTDTLPSSVTFQSSSIPSCTHPGGPGGQVICNVGDFDNYPFDPPKIVTIVVIPNMVGPITNTAEVATSQPDPNLNNNTASITTNVNPVTDLSISKSDNMDPVIAGTNLTYSLTVTNSGPSPATDVTITDNLPSTVTYLSASSGCSNASGTVTCTLGNLAVNSSKTVTISVTVKSSTTSQISNTASVSGNVFDSNSANNSDSETTAVQRRTDLTMTKLDSPDPVIAGNNLSYTLVVTNNGPSDVTGAGAIVISDPLPAQVTFISASPGCSFAAGTVTCSLGNLPSGSGSSVNIVVKTKSSTTGQISNTASVTTTLDHNPGNNSASAVTTVNTQANLSLTKVGSPSSVLPGGNITYNLTVTNNGPSDATGVILTDNLPSSVTFVSAPGCSQAGNVVTCNLGTIASSSNKPATIVVKVKDNATGSVQNTASVTSGVIDPAPANNSANFSTSIGEFNKVYLPFVTKPAPTILSIHNDQTGGNVTFSVLGTGVRCTVPNNTTQLCGTFAPGTYTVQVISPCGPPATFTRDYGSGPITTRVFCK